MADNSTLDPGTGGDTIRDKDRAGIKTQIVGLDLGIGTGSESLMSGAMPVTDNAGSLTVDNAGTFATQDSQKVADNAAFTDGTTPVQPAGYIFDEVAGTALTENDAGAARMDSKRSQVTVLEDATTRGQRAAVSAGGALKVDNSGVTQPVSGTVTATGPLTDTQLRASAVPVSDGAGSLTVDNAGTFAVQIAANSSVNQAQIAGTTTDTNSGSKSAGTQRVVLATDQPALTNALKVDPSAVTSPVSIAAAVAVTDNSGSLTVDAPVGTPVFSTVTPSTTGGWSKITALAQTTTKKVVKASAGTFGGYYAYNPNASVAYIQVFDLATGSVTLGTTAPDMVFGIPAGSAANLEITNGVNMATAMTLACTTTATGSTAPSTGLDLTILFK